MGVGSGLSGVGGAVRRPPPRPVPQTVAPALQQIARTVASQPIVQHAPPARPTGRGLQSVAHTVVHPAAQQAQQAQAQGVANDAVRRLMVATLAFAHQRQAALERAAAFGPRPGASPLAGLQAAPLQARLAGLRAAQSMPGVRQSNLDLDRIVGREVPAYQKMLGDLWKRAGKYYPAGARQPKTDVLGPTLYGLGDTPVDKKLFGYKTFGTHPFLAYSQGGRTHVTLDAVAPALGEAASEGAPDARTRAFFQTLPLHEWAHDFQTQQLGTPPQRARAEGGAEAFKLYVARQLGLPAVVTPEYAQWAAQQAAHGRGWVTRGQFGLGS